MDDANDVNYDYFHGYRHVDHEGLDPRFAFGFGLSYTTFAYSNLALDVASIPPDGTLVATADVTNAGSMAGDEVVQLYVGCQGTAVPRPPDPGAFAHPLGSGGKCCPFHSAQGLAYCGVAAAPVEATKVHRLDGIVVA